MLLIEEKDSGIDVVNEMKRLYGNETWAIEGIVPIRDKISRALSVQPVFTRAWFMLRCVADLRAVNATLPLAIVLMRMGPGICEIVSRSMARSPRH